NKSLSRAQKAKNDEFYTQLSDIENELRHYKEHLRGKIVYCNCDDPYESNFFKYFAYNFNHLGLKKLIATSYSKSPVSGRQLSLFGQHGGERSFAIEINEIPDFNSKGTIDSTDVEYLLKNSKHVSRKLKGDDDYCAGDFRSKECISLLKKADIVITNPPFSLFREYVAQLVKYDKEFLIIGSKNAVTYKEIFPLIKNNLLWFGHGFVAGNAFFKIFHDNLRDFASGVYDEKKGIVKFRNVCWFTNLDHAKRHEELILFKKYTPEEYPTYDNYDAIEVSKVADIPVDYDGIMGVPITFLDKYNPEQFCIVGMAKRGAGDPALKSKVYTKGDYPNYSDLNATPVLINKGVPKNTYPRILIRKNIIGKKL
ncbi:TPA: adenine-specific methyltransferase EcoRI family protein, partial [Salmonella enterica]|nr:modification methylase [Salmonella enterica subsp. enterica serovar Newport]EFT4511284.1 modification methylase [Salmonella enterica subsp. enterica serovar Stanley]